MQIEYRKIREIKPYGKNPRKNDASVKYVAQSIKDFGFKVPIVVDKDGVIIAGHTRYKAANSLGLTEVPVIVAEDLSDAQVKAYRLADNKVGEFSEWDIDLLAEELQDLSDFDMESLGFDGLKIPGEEVIEDDYELELPEEPKAKRGQVYKLGNHRLMCGDSTFVDDVQKLVGGVQIDFVNCDPPYGMNAVSNSGVLKETYGTDIMNDGDNRVAIESFNLCQTMFKNAKQVWWGANYYTECLPSSECWIVWDKANGSSDQTDCELAWANFRSVVRQFTMASEKKNRIHPTQKPCKLLKEIFDKFDKKGSLYNVIDLFGGSGFTMMTCEQMGKISFTMELDPRFVDAIITRWEQFTGKKAELIEE